MHATPAPARRPSDPTLAPATTRKGALSDLVILRAISTHTGSRRTVGITITAPLRAALGWEERDQLALQITKSGRLLVSKVED